MFVFLPLVFWGSQLWEPCPRFHNIWRTHPLPLSHGGGVLPYRITCTQSLLQAAWRVGCFGEPVWNLLLRAWWLEINSWTVKSVNNQRFLGEYGVYYTSQTSGHRLIFGHTSTQKPRADISRHKSTKTGESSGAWKMWLHLYMKNHLAKALHTLVGSESETCRTQGKCHQLEIYISFSTKHLQDMLASMIVPLIHLPDILFKKRRNTSSGTHVKGVGNSVHPPDTSSWSWLLQKISPPDGCWSCLLSFFPSTLASLTEVPLASPVARNAQVPNVTEPRGS